jgi:hypothetical protein
MRTQDLSVGMQVLIPDNPYFNSYLRGQLAIIVSVNDHSAVLRCVSPREGDLSGTWYFSMFNIEKLLPINSEETERLKDQAARQAHADKWL